MKLEYVTGEADKESTLKSILKNKLHISTRLLTKLKLNKRILVNNEIGFVNKIPSINSKIEVLLDFEEEDNILPQEGKIEILYEDEFFLAVNKLADMVVHPCSYHPNGTLANYVKYYLNNNKKIRPINRLDRGTSGVVLFAKNEYIQEAFKNITPAPVKEYIAIAKGVFDKKEGTINLPIARKADSIMEREVNFEVGQEAITKYKVEKEIKIEGEAYSILDIVLLTGRTHQIRVHMAYLGHPLYGDTLYDGEIKKSNIMGNQALHARTISFIHPITNKEIYIEAKIPENIAKLIKLH